MQAELKSFQLSERLETEPSGLEWAIQAFYVLTHESIDLD